MKNLEPIVQDVPVFGDPKSTLMTYTGVCVGGEDDGHVVSCSSPYWKHLSPAHSDYVEYVWHYHFEIWVPAYSPPWVTVKFLTSAYALLKGSDLKRLEDHVDARLKARIRQYPKASIQDIVRQTGLTEYKVKKARKEVREEDEGFL